MILEHFVSFSLSSVGLPERLLKDAPTAVTYHTAVLIQTGRGKTHPTADAGRHSGEGRCAHLTQDLGNASDHAGGHAGGGQLLLPNSSRRLPELR